MINRFPLYRGLLIQLFRANEDFKVLCEDYWQCTHNLNNLRSDNVYDHRLLIQYQLLRLELETEALRILSTFNTN